MYLLRRFKLNLALSSIVIFEWIMGSLVVPVNLMLRGLALGLPKLLVNDMVELVLHRLDHRVQLVPHQYGSPRGGLTRTR